MAHFELEHPEMEHVILASRWAMMAEGAWPERLRQPETYHLEDESPGMSSDAIFELGFINLLKELKKMGKKVPVLSSVPEQQENVTSMRHKAELPGTDYMSYATDYQRFLERRKNVMRVLQRAESEKLAEVLWMDDYFFPGGKSRELVLPNGGYMFLDDDYLSPSGATDTVLHHSEALKQFLSR